MATTTSKSTTTESKEEVSSDEKARKEFDVPAEAMETEEPKASDFRTSDDAQVAFLQGAIDEKTFAQVVNKYGKPSNPPYSRHAEVDGAYEVDLPKWAFTAPEGVGLTFKERQEVADKKEEERQAASEESEEGESLGSDTSLTAGTSSSSATSSS